MKSQRIQSSFRTKESDTLLTSSEYIQRLFISITCIPTTHEKIKKKSKIQVVNRMPPRPIHKTF